MTQAHFGLSFNRLPDSSLQIIASTPEVGYVGDFVMPYEDALTNLRTAARVMGFDLVPTVEMTQ